MSKNRKKCSIDASLTFLETWYRIHCRGTRWSVNLEQKTSRMLCMEFDGWVMQEKRKHSGTQDDLAAIKRDMEVS